MNLRHSIIISYIKFLSNCFCAQQKIVFAEQEASSQDVLVSPFSFTTTIAAK